MGTRLLITGLLCFCGLFTKGQSNALIKTYGIKSMTEYRTDYDEGDSIKYKAAYKTFNTDGKTQVDAEWDEDGELEHRKIERYEDGEEVKQIEDYPKGDNGEDPYYKKTLRTFKRGDKIEQKEFDRDGKLQEKTVYQYNKMGDLVKEVKTDEDGELEETTEYQYNDKGLLIKETERGKDGKIKKKKVYEYAFR